MTKVRFLKSPTGTHKLAYNVGEIGFVDSEIAKDLVNKGIAVVVESKLASVGFSNEVKETDQAQKKSTRSRKTDK